MSILCVDFMNLAHRARSGFAAGPAPVVYNFFRQFRSLVERFEPSRVYVVLEGKPTDRYELHKDYKANRRIAADDPRRADLEAFFKQKDEVLDMLSLFPVCIVRHPRFECDDTIANLAAKSWSTVPWTIVSSDSDFTQLLGENKHVSIWNPVKKEYVSQPDYDYVTWKSLRGDTSDNIPGVPGCGDATATKLVNDPEALADYLSDPARAEVFSRNYELINFRQWTDADRAELSSVSGAKDWSTVRARFEAHGFKSISGDGPWQKFVATFDPLWGAD